jgi:hypothetical protein
MAEGENIIMMEHDVLYPKEYLDETVAVLDEGYGFACAKNHLLFTLMGFSESIHSYHLSRFSGKKKSWLDFYNRVAIENSTQVEPSLKGIEGFGQRDLIEYEDYKIYNSSHPVLDISHGLNTTGKPFNPNLYDLDEYWGDKSEILALFDEDYVNFTNKNAIFNYGLHSVS